MKTTHKLIERVMNGESPHKVIESSQISNKNASDIVKDIIRIVLKKVTDDEVLKSTRKIMGSNFEPTENDYKSIYQELYNYL